MKTWKTENPPKDGTPIVAIGSIVSIHETGSSVAPFLLIVYWKAAGDFKGWFHHSFGECYSPYNGLAVAESPDEEVRIDLWIECPTFPRKGCTSSATGSRLGLH
jgi:hypothetical protein